MNTSTYIDELLGYASTENHNTWYMVNKGKINHTMINLSLNTYFMSYNDETGTYVEDSDSAEEIEEESEEEEENEECEEEDEEENEEGEEEEEEEWELDEEESEGEEISEEESDEDIKLIKQDKPRMMDTDKNKLFVKSEKAPQEEDEDDDDDSDTEYEPSEASGTFESHESYVSDTIKSDVEFRIITCNKILIPSQIGSIHEKNPKLGAKDYIYLLIVQERESNKIRKLFYKSLSDVENFLDEIYAVLPDAFHTMYNNYVTMIAHEGIWTSKFNNKKLLHQLKTFTKTSEFEIHPGTNNIVHDIIHPSMYPLLLDSVDTSKFNHWQRQYEESKYQWLPCEIDVDDNFKVTIVSDINGHEDKSMNPVFESVLSKLMPGYDKIWSYAKNFYMGTEEEFAELYDAVEKEYIETSLKNRRLQVITKLASYKLEPGQSFEGVWHYEGLPHENIVMTGIYYFDTEVESQIEFKRSFDLMESAKLFNDVDQSRVEGIEKYFDDFVPLGTLDITNNMLLVFPNCHAHKVKKFTNETNETVYRNILVFFMVDPDDRITSTADVSVYPRTMKKKEAYKHREELMKERKYHKESLNPREIELCEH